MKAEIKILTREEILDPQGLAIGTTLRSMGFDTVGAVRMGKYIRVELDSDDEADGKEQVAVMCEKLLANPVMENYTIDIVSEY